MLQRVHDYLFRAPTRIALHGHIHAKIKRMIRQGSRCVEAVPHSTNHFPVIIND